MKAESSERRGHLAAPELDLISERLTTLADRRRIALLEVLREGETSVQELADVVGLPHQNVSHHLIVLHRAGLLVRRRVGTANLYSIDDWSGWWLIEQAGRSIRSAES